MTVLPRSSSLPVPTFLPFHADCRESHPGSLLLLSPTSFSLTVFSAFPSPFPPLNSSGDDPPSPHPLLTPPDLASPAHSWKGLFLCSSKSPHFHPQTKRGWKGLLHSSSAFFPLFLERESQGIYNDLCPQITKLAISGVRY